MPKPRRGPSRWFRPAQDSELGKATALVAAASRLQAGSLSARKKKGTGGTNEHGLLPWQAEAWEHYDECGQLRYMVNLAADMMSRARLYLTKLDENGEPSETPPDDAGTLPAVFGGPTVQKALLHAFGLQLGVAGDCYLIGEEEVDTVTKEPTGRERWQVVSLEEFGETPDGNWWLDNGDGKREIDPETTVNVRIWKPHPRRSAEADSQVKANRRPLRVLARLSKYVQAILDSRLAGPGILLMPKELTFARADTGSDPQAAVGANQFLNLLTESMMTAIQNPDSVESVVPIIAMGPAEHLEKVRLLTMNTPLTENLAEIEKQAVTNLALGLDAPPEMLLGLADTNHWSAWQLEEATIKYVAEPLLELICAALTEQFIWPAIESTVAEPREWLIWYDPAEMTQRPDKSGDVKEAFRDGVVGAETYRRETGFSNNDRPTPAEAEWAKLLALVQAVPGIAPQLGPRLVQLATQLASESGELVGMPATVDPAQITTGEPSQPTEAPPEPATDDRALPEQAAVCVASSPAFVTACEEIVLKAIERANNRNVGRHRHQLTGRKPEEYHLMIPVLDVKIPQLLAGAWDRLPAVAARLGVEADQLEQALGEYVTVTLTAGMAHDVDRLQDHLETAVCGGRL